MQDSTLQRMSQFLSTEHSTLQAMRSSSTSEGMGRLSSFLSTVASSLVALAFVANVSELGPLFFAFSVVIFPVLIFLGVTTSNRLIQVGVSDVLMTQAINRIRHFYVETVPQAERYFTYPHYDDADAIRASVLPFGLGNEQLASAATQVAIINSLLVGTFASIVAASLFPLTLATAILVGVVVLIIVLGLYAGYAQKLQRQFLQRMEVRFPTPDA